LDVSDWRPDLYGKFGDLRLRPAMDLLAQIGALPDGAVVDLGCGAGAVGPALAARWPERALIGVDLSPAMLDEARGVGCYSEVTQADGAAWRAAGPVALIFANASLHWLADHAVLMPKLAGMLGGGGTLAVQMPRQWAAASHRFARDIATSMFAGRFDFSQDHSPVHGAQTYWEMLCGLGRMNVWETEYLHWLKPMATGHPVRWFTESTALRPILERLSVEEAGAFIAAYETALEAAYPVQQDGGALFPFLRVFFTLTVD
jgi:trans-aconitate 2-methyltransferase